MSKIFFITFVAVSFLCSTGSYAQEKKQENRNEKHFDREAFQAKRNAFITAEVGLTPEEAAKFIPLCDEYRQKRFEVGHDCRRLTREMYKKTSPTEADYIQVIDECLQVGIREAQLEKQYYEQFKKILSPEKLYKYRNAENKFARHFIRGESGENQKNNIKENNKRK